MTILNINYNLAMKTNTFSDSTLFFTFMLSACSISVYFLIHNKLFEKVLCDSETVLTPVPIDTSFNLFFI